MVVDFLLGIVHGLAMWVVSLLPEWNPLYGLYVEHLPSQGGDFQGGGELLLAQFLITGNYFLPLYEGVAMIGIYLGVVGVWFVFRQLMRFIPGLG